MPASRKWDQAIELKEGFEGHWSKVYQLNIKEEDAMNKFINENLAKGYICPSKSLMAAPFFFVAKKDGKLHPCQDYCELNKGTIKNAYLLPLIDDLLRKLKGACFFTKLDIC